ncbi:MAG: hypothetical protein J6X19_01330 [Clostridia bacterium]|nr:hypothetical protein [Clostridia bacterium]
MNNRELYNAFAEIDDTLIRDSAPSSASGPGTRGNTASRRKIVLSVLISAVLLAAGIAAGIILSNYTRSRSNAPAGPDEHIVSDPAATRLSTAEPSATPLASATPGDIDGEDLPDVAIEGESTGNINAILYDFARVEYFGDTEDIAKIDEGKLFELIDAGFVGFLSKRGDTFVDCVPDPEHERMLFEYRGVLYLCCPVRYTYTSSKSDSDYSLIERVFVRYELILPDGSAPTSERDPFKEQEGAKLAITDPTEEQMQIISVYQQLYPEYKDRQPLLGDTDPIRGEVFFVPPEWYNKGYPAILGRHIFEQIGEYRLCAYLQNEEFRFGVFDNDYVLRSEVIAGNNIEDSIANWPCCMFEKGGNYYIAVEFYSARQGIYSSSTVIYALPSLTVVWRDSELLENDPGSEHDQYRFAINGNDFDIYEYEYHNGWMEPRFKERIPIASVI